MLRILILTLSIVAFSNCQTLAKQVESPGKRWLVHSENHPVSIFWRREIESNLRWLILRERRAQNSKQETASVVILADYGCWSLGVQSIVHALESEGIGCQVLDRSRWNMKWTVKYKAIIIPGGFAPFQSQAIGGNGLQKMVSFVKSGETYMGVCAGAYLASREVVWQGSTYPYPMKLFDGQAVGEITTIAKWPNTGTARMTVTGAGKKAGLGFIDRQPSHYAGGPRFLGVKDGNVLGRYGDGSAAMIQVPYGKGKVILMGPHFERPSPSNVSGPAEKESPPQNAGRLYLKLLDLKAAHKTKNAEKPFLFTAARNIENLSDTDRQNLECNLRWLLERTVNKRESKEASIGLWADFGSEHRLLFQSVANLEKQGHACRLLTIEDLKTTSNLKNLKLILVPKPSKRIPQWLDGPTQTTLKQLQAKGVTFRPLGIDLGQNEIEKIFSQGN